MYMYVGTFIFPNLWPTFYFTFFHFQLPVFIQIILGEPAPHTRQLNA